MPGDAALDKLAPIASRALSRLDLRASAFRPNHRNSLILSRARNVENAGIHRKCAVFQRIGSQFVYDHCEDCGRGFADAHPRHGDPDAPAESAKIVIRRQQYGQQITKQRRGRFRLAWNRPNEIVRTPKSGQPERELTGHVVGG